MSKEQEQGVAHEYVGLVVEVQERAVSTATSSADIKLLRTKSEVSTPDGRKRQLTKRTGTRHGLQSCLSLLAAVSTQGGRAKG